MSLISLNDNGRPFPCDKTTLYDSGIKTPLIAKWPGAIKSGVATNSLVSAVDIAPTIIELADLNWKSVGMQPTSGRSLTDILYAENCFVL